MCLDVSVLMASSRPGMLGSGEEGASPDVTWKATAEPRALPGPCLPALAVVWVSPAPSPPCSSPFALALAGTLPLWCWRARLRVIDCPTSLVPCVLGGLCTHVHLLRGGKWPRGWSPWVQLALGVGGAWLFWQTSRLGNFAGAVAKEKPSPLPS